MKTWTWCGRILKIYTLTMTGRQVNQWNNDQKLPHPPEVENRKVNYRLFMKGKVPASLDMEMYSSLFSFFSFCYWKFINTSVNFAVCIPLTVAGLIIIM